MIISAKLYLFIALALVVVSLLANRRSFRRWIPYTGEAVSLYNKYGVYQGTVADWQFALVLNSILAATFGVWFVFLINYLFTGSCFVELDYLAKTKIDRLMLVLAAVLHWVACFIGQRYVLLFGGLLVALSTSISEIQSGRRRVREVAGTAWAGTA